MAEALLSFGVERLWNLLVRESERLQGVEEEFNGLKSDLSMLRCFLEDADAKKHTSAMVNNTIKEIREIVFDAEDIVETFLIKEDLGETSGIRRCLKRLARIVDRRELASDIRAISKRISKVIRNMQTLGVQQVIVNEGYMQSLQERQRRMRQTFSNDNETVLVGLEENVTKLVCYLVDEGSSSQVVSITGMGGIGKTTLAKQIFNHETVKSHFEGLAWVCVSQQLTRKYVWETILQKLRPEYKVLEMTEEEIQEKLFQVLETQKALIVLDDIWREEDWDMIKPTFPREKGWKILLTSRNEGVALRADPKCFIFKPDCLNPEESWTLFRGIAFPNTTENKVDEEMEEMGKKMIKDCGGLPLAIKLLGGLLAAQHTLSEWKRVHENIGSHIVGETSFNDRNISSVYHILYLSFEELPIYLKHCFLYLAQFPEDYIIDVQKLAYYWAAEGIQRPRYYDGASIRDVGDGYIEELVKRNMIISERDIRTSRFETCQLHDIMREVCLLKAEEENFLQIFQGTSTGNPKSPCKSRRLAVHELDETFNVENPSLRTLLFVEGGEILPVWSASSLFFYRLQLMRVLDISDSQFEGGKVPSSIGKLIHLRYLSLKGAYVTRIPSSMRKLKKLIYLNLDVFGELYMPNILKEMRELTYLHLPKNLSDEVKLELGTLVNLETLENFSIKQGSVRDLQGMTRLRALSIYIKVYGIGINSMENLSSSLSQLRCLENLTITDKEVGFIPRGFVLDCVHLKHLKLSIYMPRLPDEQHLPSHLIFVDLSWCRLEEDPMPFLEKLGQLKEVSLGKDAFLVRRMVCSRGGFPQLQKLSFFQLDEWEEWIVQEGSMPLLHTLAIWICGKLEEWIVEEGSMPLLHTLNIGYCQKLMKFPDGLRFLTSLKYVSVEVWGEQWNERFSEQQPFPSRLTKLRIHECRLEVDPMPVFETMLHLKEVTFSEKSFCGKRMVCSRGGFTQLQKLELWGLEEWEEWIVEEGSMPLLQNLTIESCVKLEKWIVEKGSMPLLHTLRIWNCRKLELPDGMQFITSLKYLTMGEEWKERLMEGGEDYYKVRHVPCVRFF